MTSFCVNALDKVWHGFAMPNNFNHRYSFGFIFFVLLIAWRAFGVIVKEKVFSLSSAITTWILVLCSAGYIILNHYTYLDSVTVLLDVVFVLAGILLLYFGVRSDSDTAAVLFGGFVLLFFVNSHQAHRPGSCSYDRSR